MKSENTPIQQVTRIAAYGLVEKNKKILLCRMSKQLPQYEGMWTLPGGGIEFGEAPEAAVVREVREETGMIVRTRKLEDVDSLTVEDKDRTFHAIRILYHAELIGGELAYEVGGTTDMCGWFTEEEAKGLQLVDLVRLGLKHVFAS